MDRTAGILKHAVACRFVVGSSHRQLQSARGKLRCMLYQLLAMPPCHHAISLSDTSIQSPCLTCYTSLRLCVLPAPQELLLHSKGHNWTRANAYQTQVCRLLQPMLLRPQADTVCNSLLVLAQHFTDCSLPTAAAPGACLQPIAALALRAAGARGWPPVRETLEHVVRWYPTARTAM
jgi:hypothetical protein